MEFVELNNGVRMPILGYGTFQITDEQECERCVLDAIEIGYRLIDTAQAYGNEAAVGKAIKKCGIPREELFVTTKVWISNAGYEKAKKSIEESLARLQLDYLDLLLVHQPFNDYYGTYRAMIEAYKEGKVRAIGVSNFYPDRLIDLIKFNEVVPAVNQVELHPFFQQVEARKIMKKYGVQAQAWSPFDQGRNNLFENEPLQAVGKKHGKTSAQVALRFLIQEDIVVIPKTVSKQRMLENFTVFDFELDDEDMNRIRGLDTGKSSFFSHYDPEIVERFTSFAR
ncbi:MAG: aldo/keto reductase [Firmicutes bacterium]|nr:aldo/keto reductase [Bacillota bacterium]